MKLIDFNYSNGERISFHLDFVVFMEAFDDGMTVALENGKSIYFRFDYDEFIAKVYSDSSEYKEYEIVEFDEIEIVAGDSVFD
jgi:hypothetical protein